MRGLMLVAALVVAPAATAQQQPPCAPLPLVTQILERDFGERMMIAARMAGGGTMHIFSSETGAWSLVVVSPTGIACLVADGTAWSIVGVPGRKS